MAATTSRKRKRVDYTEDIIVVAVGAEKKQFNVHQDILASSSKVFKAGLSGRWTSNGTFNLPDANPAAFQTYVTYIYTGVLEIVASDTGEAYTDNDDPELRFDGLIDLYILADAMIDDKCLRNAIMDELKNIAKSTKNRPGAKLIARAFKCTAESSMLCRWLIEENLYETSPTWLDDHRNELPAAFLRSLMYGWAAATADKSIRYEDPGTFNDCTYHEHDDEVPPGPKCKTEREAVGAKA